MTRRYSLVMEGGEGGYSAYIPELPTIVVTGRSRTEVKARAAEAVAFYLEVLREERSPAADVEEIEVEIPA